MESKELDFGSLEPKIITQEFVNRLVKLKKICDHFHLSLQSGCNETLKRMNRKYTVEEFEQIVKILRKTFPNVALTTDIIVGFPGETEEEFETTYKFLEKIKFSKMHVFKYSPRKGTRAASMREQVDGSIKEKRSSKLINLSNQNEKEFIKQFIGKNLEVLYEEKERECTKGHTTNYIIVKTDIKDIENQILKTKISKEENLELIGIIV